MLIFSKLPMFRTLAAICALRPFARAARDRLRSPGVWLVVMACVAGGCVPDQVGTGRYGLLRSRPSSLAGLGRRGSWKSPAVLSWLDRDRKVVVPSPAGGGAVGRVGSKAVADSAGRAASAVRSSRVPFPVEAQSTAADSSAELGYPQAQREPARAALSRALGGVESRAGASEALVRRGMAIDTEVSRRGNGSSETVLAAQAHASVAKKTDRASLPRERHLNDLGTRPGRRTGAASTLNNSADQSQRVAGKVASTTESRPHAGSSAKPAESTGPVTGGVGPVGEAVACATGKELVPVEAASGRDEVLNVEDGPGTPNSVAARPASTNAAAPGAKGGLQTAAVNASCANQPAAQAGTMSSHSFRSRPGTNSLLSDHRNETAAAEDEKQAVQDAQRPRISEGWATALELMAAEARRRVAVEPDNARSVAQALLIEMANRVEAQGRTAPEPDLATLAQLEPQLLRSLGLAATQCAGEAKGGQSEQRQSGVEPPRQPPRVLRLTNACYSTRIDGFGRYERVRQELFRPGELLLVYCEVEGFESKRVPAEASAGAAYEYVTELDAVVTVEAKSGERLYRLPFPLIEDRCATRRRDFFLALRFQLPKELAAGEYRLKIEVRDRLGGGQATAELPLRVRRPAATHARCAGAAVHQATVRPQKPSHEAKTTRCLAN